MEHQNKLSIPAAIIVAGILIALAIFATKSPGQPSPTNAPGQPASIKLNPVTAQEHVRGNAKAKVVIVEFSDLECPFCKMFHPTMQKLFANYNGDMAWVYRHFPLDSIHPKTRKEAEAAECAAELGGNDAFWKFVDRVFEITPGNNQLDPNQLYNIADYIGLDKVAFKACLDSGKEAAKVESQFQDGVAAGVTGTPMSFILYKNQKIQINGADSYESIKAKIDSLLKS